MLPQEFELYGSRFRWIEVDAFRPAEGACISLIKTRQPLPPEAVTWVSHDEANQLRYGKSGAGFVYRFDNIGEFLLPRMAVLSKRSSNLKQNLGWWISRFTAA